MSGVAFQHSGDGRFCLLGVLHQRQHLPEGGVLARMGNLDAQQAVEIQRSAEDRHSGADLRRDRFAGNGRHVEAGITGEDLPIGGNLIARANLNHVAGAQLLAADIFQRSVLAQASRSAVRQLAQPGDGLAGSHDAALFQNMAENHDHRQQRGGHQIAQRPRAQHRQHDQQVGHPVEIRMQQAVPAGAKYRHGNQQPGHAGQNIADRRLIRRHGAPEQAEQQQPHGYHRQRQPARHPPLLRRGLKIVAEVNMPVAARLAHGDFSLAGGVAGWGGRP